MCEDSTSDGGVNSRSCSECERIVSWPLVAYRKITPSALYPDDPCTLSELPSSQRVACVDGTKDSCTVLLESSTQVRHRL